MYKPCLTRRTVTASAKASCTATPHCYFKGQFCHGMRHALTDTVGCNVLGCFRLCRQFYSLLASICIMAGFATNATVPSLGTSFFCITITLACFLRCLCIH
ncbi:hypothetical protein B0O99DRAFT_178165 [Bisporella sp. PMI_857]|nr:hypothetical protein B0O99DRAFT_178165 [Bisporella sp. PMI_857]